MNEVPSEPVAKPKSPTIVRTSVSRRSWMRLVVRRTHLWSVKPLLHVESLRNRKSPYRAPICVVAMKPFP